MTPLWPLALYAGLVLIVVVSMIGLSSVLGERHREQSTGRPYESGIAGTGSTRIRFDVKFYLVAMFFVIFDLESVFIYAWAVAIRELGWPGYMAIIAFVGMLAVVLLYLWRLGGLDWGSAGLRRDHAEQ
jgi:NADH-quinone oxidoreductase subunit A